MKASSTIQEVVPLVAVADLCPSRPSRRTIHRWIERGVAGGVKLEGVVRSGGRTFITKKAIERFLRRCTERRGEQR